MNNKVTSTALLLGALLMGSHAYADCPGPFLRDVKRAYEQGKTFESQGKKEDALFAYHGAEGTVCEGANPYEADAAKRAAPLGLELGAIAEKKGNFINALRLYDAGGHFSAGDRAMMLATRAKADDVSSYQRALEHFNNRGTGGEVIASNNAAAIKVTGRYAPDPAFIAEVKAMPPKGVELNIQKEAAAFNEQYLQEMVTLAQSRVDDPTNASEIQRTISAQQAFAQRWKQVDHVKASRDALQALRMWSLNVHDESFAKNTAAKAMQLSEQRASTLRTKYSGSPKLLEEAIAYYMDIRNGNESAKLDALLTATRSQAMKLGDEANGKQRHSLAAEYYEVAGDSGKADAVRERQQQLAMQKMQPSIDQMHKQAEAMKAQYSDPAKVEEMKRQAEAIRKSMQQQQAASKANNKKSAAELEKELGL